MTHEESPGVADGLRVIATGHGTVRVVRVARALPGLASTAFAYAAVVVEPQVSYRGSSVGMLVTVHDPDADPVQTANILETIDQTPDGHWRGEERQVDNVYAVCEFRGGHCRGISAPVAVGRLLLETGWLTSHAASRSADGDRWARAVGGAIPELVGAPTGRYEHHIRDWLEDLNADLGEFNGP